MEDYQRRKLYRVHLKNISQIKNCRTPINYTAYSSRLFNFSKKTTFCKKQLQSLQKLNSLHKLSRNKKNQQKKISNYLRVKQNVRLVERLANVSGSIDMEKYQQEYVQHKKLMKLHSKVKQFKRVILYKIYDITFKGITPNLKQQYTIYEQTPFIRNSKYKQHLCQKQNDNTKQRQHQNKKENYNEKTNINSIILENKMMPNNEYILRGNIHELRNMIIKGFRDQRLIFRILGMGKNQGTVSILNGEKMVPIVYKNNIVGTLILEVS